MAFKLVCVSEYHGYSKGQEVIDPEQVADLLTDREHHFVRVNMTDEDNAKLAAMKAPAVKAEAAKVAAAVAAMAADAPAADKPTKSK
jgi:hypothetical protein